MLQQVALLSTGDYARDGDISSIEIPTPGGRRQVILGKVDQIMDEDIAVLYTTVGKVNECVDLHYLLALNTSLRHSRTALLNGDEVVLVATFDLINTSVKECARVLQELAAVADDLERRWYSADIS
ncbi:MAG: hypothetical protein C0600_04190 [Ignavibacteria bacterium]|nr:MAG: hypothetical protein C0600_04190 [Ignavibacteria bacterium]